MQALTSRCRSGIDDEGRSVGSFVSFASPAVLGTVPGRTFEARTLGDPSAPHRRVVTGEADLELGSRVAGEVGADEPGDCGPRIPPCASASDGRSKARSSSASSRIAA